MTRKYATIKLQDHHIQTVTEGFITWICYPDYLEAIGGTRESAAKRMRRQKDINPTLVSEKFTYPGSRQNIYVRLIDLDLLDFGKISEREAAVKLNATLAAQLAPADMAVQPKKTERTTYPNLWDMSGVAPESVTEPVMEEPAVPVIVEPEEVPVPFAIPEYIDSIDVMKDRLDFTQQTLTEMSHVIDGLNKRIDKLVQAIDERSRVIVNLDSRLEAIESQKPASSNGSIADMLSQLGVKLAVVPATA